MNTNSHTKLTCLAAATALLLPFAHGVAQEAAVTTTTVTSSGGTITSFQPEQRVLVLRAEAADPVTYRYTEKTTVVDEAGAPVAMSVLQQGVPAKVYYTTVGDQMVVEKVVVTKKVAPAVPVVTEPVIVEKETTTTTTTTTTED